MKYKKALVTGGAGFIGSHLVDTLHKKDIEVLVVDNLLTGKKENLNSLDLRSSSITACVLPCSFWGNFSDSMQKSTRILSFATTFKVFSINSL